jgi:hypothetical protein
MINNTTTFDKDNYIKIWGDFLKAFFLYAVFAAGLVIFSILRGFSPSERPVVAVFFVFILFNLLFYAHQLTAGFYKSGNTALSPGLWTVLMFFPGLNIFVLFKIYTIHKEILEGMRMKHVLWHPAATRRLGFPMMVSLAVVVGVFNWLTMTKVTGLTQLGRLRDMSRADSSPYAQAFKESSDLMQKGEFYQGLQLLRKGEGMSPGEQETYEDMVKTGYQGHAFVLSERILRAIKEGDTEGVRQPLAEYFRWVEIYCEPMGIPQGTLHQLKDEMSRIQEAFPSGGGASFQDIRQYYRDKAKGLLEDETAQALLQTYVDVLLFNALYNIQDSHKTALP